MDKFFNILAPEHYDIDVNGKRHTHTGMDTNMHAIIDLKPKKLHKIKIRYVAQITGGRDPMYEKSEWSEVLEITTDERLIRSVHTKNPRQSRHINMKID